MNRLSFVAGAFVLTVAALYGTVLHAQDGWGNIKGRVVWGPKEIPVQMPIAAIDNNADKAHCMKDGKPILDENWVVDKKSRGLQWCIIWLINDDPKDKAPLRIHPKLKAVPEAAVVDQPLCAFIPHAIAMREGQVLVAKNSSKIAHNIKWNSGNVIVPAGGEFKIKGLVAEKVPMTIECNIHSWMRGSVGIFTHPYFAVTDNGGYFEIKDAPAGKYRLVVWNTYYLGGTKGRFGQPIVIAANDLLDVGDLAFTPPAQP